MNGPDNRVGSIDRGTINLLMAGTLPDNMIETVLHVTQTLGLSIIGSRVRVDGTLVLEIDPSDQYPTVH